LVAPLRIETIITVTGAAPNPRRRPIATNKPSTSAAGHRPLSHPAPHKLLAQVEHPQVDLAGSSLSTGSPAAQRAMP
jgi:hypothetical protein